MAREFDVVITGAGPESYTVALKTVEFGLRVVVIEAKKIGSIYVNRGYIPTKALLHAFDMFHIVQSYDEPGVSTDLISFDFRKMQEYKRGIVVKYRDGIKCGFEKLDVKIAYGTAAFRGDRTVEVELKEGGREFFRENVAVITTGAVPYMNRISDVDPTDVWNSDRLLAAKSWNFDRLTTMGGGVIVAEFATMFNNLCSYVTIVEKQKHLMVPIDDVMSAEPEKGLRQKDVDARCDATVIEILEDGGGLNYVITPNGEGKPIKVRVGQILITIGRRPNVERFLGKGISLEIKDGKIAVSNDFETGERGIYVIGGVSARAQLAHVAAAQDTYVAEKMAGRPHSIKLGVVPNGVYVSLPVVPNCVYTDPEIATVDITGEIAREKRLKVRYGHFFMKENGKSTITGGENGFVRLVFEAYSNTIIGAQMMCPRAADMIGEIVMATANELSVEGMSFAIRAQPTYNEGIGVTIEDTMRKK